MSLTFSDLMNDSSNAMANAMKQGQNFLSSQNPAALLPQVGTEALPVAAEIFPDKRWFQKSYGREVTSQPDDLMVGQGMFYLTEQGRLFLDCTGGHYQMTWGYEHPELMALIQDGLARGIVPDNHSNIPAAPVKRLAEKLVQILNPGADLVALQTDNERLNTVLLATATGTVACSAAMKMMLLHYKNTKPNAGTPVFIMLDGNYHGSDFFAQRLRGMWTEYFTNFEVIAVQPGDIEELEQAFKKYSERIAGFWAEPIMMNREAINVPHEYLYRVRQLCDETGALMAIDEIQTGFWYPEVLYSVRAKLEPDFIILGKGMTAGFHPLSAVVYKGKLDNLAQYDAISTNGNAALAAYLGLGCIALIEQQASQIETIGASYQKALEELVHNHSDLLMEVRGEGHMCGLKFHDRADALGFHRSALEHGLWLRAHTYYEGHSTVLSKFALILNDEILQWYLTVVEEILSRRSWQS